LQLGFFAGQVKASPGFDQPGPTVLISLILIPLLPYFHRGLYITSVRNMQPPLLY
jgi:hypothetical protein